MTQKPLKILALVGSPRNEESWTYKYMRILEEKMQAIQPVEFEYVFVERLNVPFCDGCLKCINVGESACPEYDTIGPVAAKMDEADGLILGSPIHTFNITGLMKNFVEYFMYKRNRPSFFRQESHGDGNGVRRWPHRSAGFSGADGKRLGLRRRYPGGYLQYTQTKKAALPGEDECGRRGCGADFHQRDQQG